MGNKILEIIWNDLKYFTGILFVAVIVVLIAFGPAAFAVNHSSDWWFAYPVYVVLAYILRVAVRAEDADHRRAIRGGKDDG